MIEHRTDGLPLSSWINVVLSFLFMVIGVPLLLWFLALLVGAGWQRLTLYSPYCWGVLALSAVLGFGNAFRYYERAKSKLTK